MSTDKDIQKIAKRIERTEEYLSFQKAFLNENHAWWHKEVDKTVAAIQRIQERDYQTKEDIKKLNRLQGAFNYLMNKGNFENQLNSKIETVVRAFDHDPYQFGVIKGGLQLTLGVGKILASRNLLDIARPKKAKK